MKSILKANVFLVIVVTLLSASWANAGGYRNKNLVVLLAGTGYADFSGDQFTQLGLVAPTDVACFDMDLIDARTDRVIGSGSDCLSEVGFSDTGGVMLTATSFFHFPGGTLVSQGLVTVQPKLHGLDGYTHVTGAAPSATENNVIYGDGRFRRAGGSVRLSGLVDMSDFAFNSGDPIVFDCVFILDLW